MKSSLIISLLLVSSLAFAQQKIPSIDKSPLDMSYCPAGFPVLKIQQKANEPLLARVIYSRPALNGRKIFGGLVEYGKVWRLGANEATEIEIFKDVYIKHKKVKKGRYTMLAIPNENQWTVILNKESHTWGSYVYSSSKDLIRFEQNVEKTDSPVENFSIYFDNKEAGSYQMIMQWDSVKVTLPIMSVN
jgi:hypothetical protein